MTMKYTAEDMREMASAVLNECEDSEHGLLYPSRYFSGHLFYPEDAAEMLRQAADMMEREESDVVRCRKCQTERTGEGYGDVPPHVGEDDICDRCEIAEHLRRGKDADERELKKNYEYVCYGRVCHTLNGARIYAAEKECQGQRPIIVRREVRE